MTQLNYFCSFFYQNSLLFSITFLNIFVAKCIFFLLVNWKWMVIKNERNFCIYWAFTHTDFRQCELFDLSRFTKCQLKLLYKIFKLKWCWCAKGGFFCKWIFPISNVYKILLSICCWLNVDLKWTFILAQFNVQILNFVYWEWMNSIFLH